MRSETIAVTELQGKQAIPNETIRPKSNGRILIINETIEIFLNAYSDDEISIADLNQDGKAKIDCITSTKDFKEITKKAEKVTNHLISDANKINSDINLVQCDSKKELGKTYLGACTQQTLDTENVQNEIGKSVLWRLLQKKPDVNIEADIEDDKNIDKDVIDLTDETSDSEPLMEHEQSKVLNSNDRQNIVSQLAQNFSKSMTQENNVHKDMKLSSQNSFEDLNHVASESHLDEPKSLKDAENPTEAPEELNDSLLMEIDNTESDSNDKKLEVISKKYPNLKSKNNVGLVCHLTEPHCLKENKNGTDVSSALNDSAFMQIDNANSKNEEKVVNTTLSEEDNLQLIQCPYCNYKSPKEGIIKKHIVHYHALISNCFHCDYQSNSSKNMLSHLLKHDEISLKCPLCEEEISLLKMNSHLQIKHSRSIFRHCMLCNTKIKSFKSSVTQTAYLRRHVLDFHFKDVSYNCPACDFTTTLDLEMKSHIYMNHDDLKGSIFSCTCCSFIALNISNLLSHSKVHNEKLNKCSTCQSTSFSRLWLKLHKRTHTRVSSYKCLYCHIKVKAHYLLKYHIQKFHKVKPNSSKHLCMKRLQK